MKAIEHILKEDHEKVKIDDMQFRFLSGGMELLMLSVLSDKCRRNIGITERSSILFL